MEFKASGMFWLELRESQQGLMDDIDDQEEEFKGRLVEFCEFIDTELVGVSDNSRKSFTLELTESMCTFLKETLENDIDKWDGLNDGYGWTSMVRNGTRLLDALYENRE